MRCARLELPELVALAMHTFMAMCNRHDHVAIIMQCLCTHGHAGSSCLLFPAGNSKIRMRIQKVEMAI